MCEREYTLNGILFSHVSAAAAKLLQSCLTLCDPIDGSPPGSPVPGILQARTLERVAISFSNAWKWKVKRKSLSRVWPFATPWTEAYQAPPSMGFSRQEYWSGFSHEKGGNPAICHTDKTWGHYAKLNKPNRKRQILHAMTYMWILKTKSKELKLRNRVEK